MRYVDHITIDGKTYHTGTVFIVPGYYARHIYDNFEATFIAYDTEYHKVCYEMSGFAGNGPYRQGRCTLEQFEKKIISVKEEKNEHVKCPVKKRHPEMQMDGMFEAWILYIVAMVVSVIFNDRIGLWLLWSLVFFGWRHGKIEKEGFYYEW